MQCINSAVSKFAVALGIVTIVAVATPVAARAGTVSAIDDAVTGKAMLGRFDFVGSWQHVRGKNDGRSNGTSTRSTRVGDVAILGFMGTRVRLYGIVGPSGGRAGIAVDEASTGGKPFDFYAPRVKTHVLIYQSPVMPAGLHTVSVVVWGTRNQHGRYYYVNIDGAEVEN